MHQSRLSGMRTCGQHTANFESRTKCTPANTRIVRLQVWQGRDQCQNASRRLANTVHMVCAKGQCLWHLAIIGRNWFGRIARQQRFNPKRRQHWHRTNSVGLTFRSIRWFGWLHNGTVHAKCQIRQWFPQWLSSLSAGLDTGYVQFNMLSALSLHWIYIGYLQQILNCRKNRIQRRRCGNGHHKSWHWLLEPRFVWSKRSGLG